MNSACSHLKLCLEPSAYASKAGYKRPTEQQRISAALARSSKSKVAPDQTLFPAPLILPDDDLALDPKYPPQSLRQWLREEERNHVTPERNTVYVAPPPKISPDMEAIRTWAGVSGSDHSVRPPTTEDVADYLSAYYHGVPVKLLPESSLTFASWDTGSKSKAMRNALQYIGLNTSSECVRIRTRASKDRVFARQLNLDDLLDGAISILPDDAFALIMLVDHDLYEDPDDVFVCGRAYGGSRVAVISSARYHPALDARQEVERTHAWPASHCEAYIDSLQPSKPAKRPKLSHGPGKISSNLPTGGMQAAVAAYKPDNSTTLLNGLWLGRVCRTAAHELGHCFGMDHCVYYACSMQGSASLKEDVRQPPYLCPVDLAKLLSATGTDATVRYEAIAAVCAKHVGVHLFDAFRAWILVRLNSGTPTVGRY